MIRPLFIIFRVCACMCVYVCVCERAVLLADMQYLLSTLSIVLSSDGWYQMYYRYTSVLITLNALSATTSHIHIRTCTHTHSHLHTTVLSLCLSPLSTVLLLVGTAWAQTPSKLNHHYNKLFCMYSIIIQYCTGWYSNACTFCKVGVQCLMNSS